jgi:hypothetical protein
MRDTSRSIVIPSDNFPKLPNVCSIELIMRKPSGIYPTVIIAYQLLWLDWWTVGVWVGWSNHSVYAIHLRNTSQADQHEELNRCTQYMASLDAYFPVSGHHALSHLVLIPEVAQPLIYFAWVGNSLLHDS